MTDNEIIKALEMCSNIQCKWCPLVKTDYCTQYLIGEAFDLIKRQQAEIERLQKENNQFANIGKMYSEIKAEAVKVFAERVVEQLKESSKIYCEEYGQRENTLYLWDAIEIVKQMVGANNDR